MTLTERTAIFHDVSAERERQLLKWGPQSHPNGTGENFKFLADDARYATDQAAQEGELTWQHILREEFYEAMAEESTDNLKKELIQAAAVIFAWLEDLATKD